MSEKLDADTCQLVLKVSGKRKVLGKLAQGISNPATVFDTPGMLLM